MAMTTPSLSPEQYRAMAAKPAKRSKYGAEPTVVDGIRFHSKREAARWSELKLLEKAGAISHLQRQVKHRLEGRDGPLLAGGSREYAYVSDFAYFDVESSRYIVEDVKGFDTPLGKLKLSIMAAQGLPVRVVR